MTSNNGESLTDEEKYALDCFIFPMISVNQPVTMLILHYDISSAKAHQILISAILKLKAQFQKGKASERATLAGLKKEIEGMSTKPEHRMGWISELVEKGSFVIWDKDWQSLWQKVLQEKK